MAAPRPASIEDDLPLPDPLTEAEARAFFDREARRLLGIPGDEFLRRWDDGAYDGLPEDDLGRKVVALWMLLPLARPLNPDADGRSFGRD